MKYPYLVIVLAMALGIAAPTAAHAEVPDTMAYHGTLSDASGQPLDATVEVTFRLYDASSGGSEAWSETHTIDVNAGDFTAVLGETSPFASVFDGSDYWLEITIDGETLSPRTPVDSVPYAFRAGKADDADTLEGKTAAELTVSGASAATDVSYDNATSGLTATDVQAALDELAQLRSRVDALESNLEDAGGNPIDVAVLQTRVTQNETDISTLQTDTTANTTAISANQSDITANTTAIGTNQSDIASNSTDIAANASAISTLESLTQDMARTTINGNPAVTFTGVNVHVRSGAGSTEATPNGLGNLIVGYDEARPMGSDKSGSHNLVVGSWHNYTSYGGLVAGYNNNVTGMYASVSGGANNTASAWYASISGGAANTASEAGTSVSGGSKNAASAIFASVGGGEDNEAAGDFSFVGGGSNNTAFADHSAVLAGYANEAGDAASGDSSIGEWAAVSGGRNGVASGDYSSVSGGYYNKATGRRSSVSGGGGNEASGDRSSVSGGDVNTASGSQSSISGGQGESVSGQYDWAAGDTYFVSQ